MEGRITYFNQQEGVGKILNRNKKVLPFDMDGWVDFDMLPNTGLIVEFEVKGDKAVEIVSKERPKGDGEASDEVGAIKSPKECIEEYFVPVSGLIGEYAKLLESKKELDFKRMKRFLLTAYNDLYELDSSLADNSLEQKKNEIISLENKYGSFRRVAGFPLGYAFEKIFLENQPNYQKILTKKERTLQRITAYASKEKPLLYEIEAKERDLKKMEEDGKKGTEEHKVKETTLKNIRKQYVDTLHYVSTQRELLELISKQIDNFQKKYFKSFVREFEPLVRFYDAKLIKILNVRAYEFDSRLWGRAKRSKLIRQFFMDAGIEGTYSSKTFLKYYLRTLDKDKLNENNRSLFALLKYLESLGSENILVIRSNKELLNKTKYLIENIDKELNVTATIDPSETFKYAIKHRPDIIILEHGMRVVGVSEYIKKFNELVPPDSSTPLYCVIVPSDIAEDELKAIKSSGVKNIISASLGDVEFTDVLRRIL